MFLFIANIQKQVPSYLALSMWTLLPNHFMLQDNCSQSSQYACTPVGRTGVRKGQEQLPLLQGTPRKLSTLLLPASYWPELTGSCLGRGNSLDSRRLYTQLASGSSTAVDESEDMAER